MLEAVVKCISHNVVVVSSVNDVVCLADWRSASLWTEFFDPNLLRSMDIRVSSRTNVKVSLLFSLTGGEVVFWRLDL